MAETHIKVMGHKEECPTNTINQSVKYLLPQHNTKFYEYHRTVCKQLTTKNSSIFFTTPNPEVFLGS